MKKAGVAMLFIGLVTAIFAFRMDTTVQSGSSRVHNVGLMSDRQNILILAGVLAIVGAIFAARGPWSGSAGLRHPKQRLQELNTAIARGDIETVRAILREDIDVNESNEWGASPLAVAKSHERAEILGLLQEHQRQRASAPNDA